MINLNDITLVPKTRFVVGNSPQHTNKIPASAFKRLLIDLVIKIKLSNEKIDLSNQNIKQCDILLTKLLATSKPSQTLDDCKYHLDYWKQRVVEDNNECVEYNKDLSFYLDQIDQDKGEYTTLMMFDISEWYVK